MAGTLHGMWELKRQGMTGKGYGNGVSTVWARYGICELALRDPALAKAVRSQPQPKQQKLPDTISQCSSDRSVVTSDTQCHDRKLPDRKGFRNMS
jgi:hypothetical protein